CFLLAIAAKRVFPDRRLVISHSLGEGYYYYFAALQNIKDEDLKALEDCMRDLIRNDYPIDRREISYADALSHFEKTNQEDTALLLRQRNESRVHVYVCGGFIDLAHGPLAPGTGSVCCFEFKNLEQGFLLRYPAQGEPGKLRPYEDLPNLTAIYKEYKAWGKILGVNAVGRLNDIIARKKIIDFIRVAEALHNKKIASIADSILEIRDRVKVVLIAGPSSSGKTTFTKKLTIHLQVVGFNPIAVSLDDYFLPRERTPLDENGGLDFEALEALDVELINRHLLELFEGREVLIPDFDFKTGRQADGGKPLRMGERNILLIEGIHGLNDGLTPLIPGHLKYKIYVSALTQLNLDDHNRIATTDNRLLRRMVRDYNFRGYSALDTLARWPSVRRGENRNIFPFQNNANAAFNTALDYELAVLKVYAEPLLKTVKPFHEQYNEAVRLLSFLNNFSPVPANLVPRQSILREFIGDSGFKY
ncbi:MAG: nucleoside kinase, partial [Spirochaetales bacterium]